MRATAKVGEFAGIVHGRFDGEPSLVGTRGLTRPDAIFAGLKRPLHDGDDEFGSETVVYVTNPPGSYDFRRTRSGDTLIAVEKPIQSVFTTFVSFEPRVVAAATRTMPTPVAEEVAGVVRFWEWTESSPNEPHLPADSAQRYERRIYP
jgi:hypothetical protein